MNARGGRDPNILFLRGLGPSEVPFTPTPSPDRPRPDLGLYFLWFQAPRPVRDSWATFRVRNRRPLTPRAGFGSSALPEGARAERRRVSVLPLRRRRRIQESPAAPGLSASKPKPEAAFADRWASRNGPRHPFPSRPSAPRRPRPPLGRVPLRPGSPSRVRGPHSPVGAASPPPPALRSSAHSAQSSAGNSMQPLAPEPGGRLPRQSPPPQLGLPLPGSAALEAGAGTDGKGRPAHRPQVTRARSAVGAGRRTVEL